MGLPRRCSMRLPHWGIWYSLYPNPRSQDAEFLPLFCVRRINSSLFPAKEIVCQIEFGKFRVGLGLHGLQFQGLKCHERPWRLSRSQINLAGCQMSTWHVCHVCHVPCYELCVVWACQSGLKDHLGRPSWKATTKHGVSSLESDKGQPFMPWKPMKGHWKATRLWSMAFHLHPGQIVYRYSTVLPIDQRLKYSLSEKFLPE